MEMRTGAARMLFAAGELSVFCPLLTECIAGGDGRNPDLCWALRMVRKGDRLTSDEFEILHSVLRNGTAEQRNCVVDRIAFFRGVKVRRALIEVLEDCTAPGDVRAWAAERLHQHPRGETVRACLAAIEDPEPEVRLWCIYTLGVAVSRRSPFFAETVRAIEGRLNDLADVQGWWPVRREAQSTLAKMRDDEAEDARLQEEIRGILADPNAPPGDHRWADGNLWD